MHAFQTGRVLQIEPGIDGLLCLTFKPKTKVLLNLRSKKFYDSVLYTRTYNLILKNASTSLQSEL